MRFFTPILAISFVGLSAAKTVAKTDPCKPNGCLAITSLQFYVPLEPTADDNISINFDIEGGDGSDTCAYEWKYGDSAGQKNYPSKDGGAITCSQGVFSFFFDSFTSIEEFTIDAKYSYSVGSVAKTSSGKAALSKKSKDLYCDSYLNSERCQLYNDYVSLPIYATT